MHRTLRKEMVIIMLQKLQFMLNIYAIQKTRGIAGRIVILFFRQSFKVKHEHLNNNSSSNQRTYTMDYVHII